eukprot:gene2907-3719_t
MVWAVRRALEVMEVVELVEVVEAVEAGLVTAARVVGGMMVVVKANVEMLAEEAATGNCKRHC